ncbi:CheR family methyltransferase [Pseudoduganella sp. UC29_106]|uniref:CheR family methyltransferase n=1 Tax=Pseudoduganella sp. UC29_106 TaxID=3374553 RepID=UPI0037564A3E
MSGMESPITPLTDREFGLFQRFIEKSAGIALSAAKKPLVAGRLAKRLHHHRIVSFSDYYELITNGKAPDETQLAIDLLTTNETYFFREMQHFDLLRKLAAAPRTARRPWRAWSAACATGEEAYSIAMVLADARPGEEWEVVASDISARVLATARHGHYPMVRAQHIPPLYLQRYCLKGFGPEEGTMLVSRLLRERVDFLRINLNAPALPSLDRFDVIFLRNVLIYFSPAVRRHVVSRVLELLRPGGYLFIGHAESLHDCLGPIQVVQPSVYRKV